MSTKKYEIVHSSLYLRVNNKMQAMAKGENIELDPKHAEKMLASGKIKEVLDKKVVNVSKKAKKAKKDEKEVNPVEPTEDK